IRLFHQFNKDGTRLTFGELAKSTQGTYGLILQRLLKPQSRLQIPLTINGNKYGLALSVIAPILHYAHVKLIDGVTLQYFIHGKSLLKFLENDFEEKDAQKVEFAFRNILNEYTRIFGAYEHRSLAYRRGMLHAFCKVVL